MYGIPIKYKNRNLIILRYWQFVSKLTGAYLIMDLNLNPWNN